MPEGPDLFEQGITADSAFLRGMILLQVRAKVGREIFTSQQAVDAGMYDSDEGFRDHVDRTLRENLVRGIVEQWKPVIRRSRV